MSTRISERIAGAGLICLVLAGCDEGAGTAGRASRREGDGGVADCAIGASAKWDRACPVKRSGTLLVIRHPDGGFRRFHIVKDGRGVEAADGAEPASVAIVDEARIELAVGTDRYRIPATIAADVRP
ncbi:MAG TPA: hypothetical protein VJM09_03405 [Sphingobium sp.]|nr:hypothetical protein [Sphingobium sp.]